MAAPYASESWLHRNAGYLAIGGLTAAFGGFVLYPYLKSQGLRAQRARLVSSAAGPELNMLGYVGTPIGPTGNYPGAKGPTPAVPTYGSYLAFGDEQGPPVGPRYPVESVATREPALGYLAFGRENGPAPGFIPVQSVATAQEAAAFEALDESLPGWAPQGFVGPLGSFYMARMPLYDEGGAYLSSGAYRVGADGTYSAPHPLKAAADIFGITPGDIEPADFLAYVHK